MKPYLQVNILILAIFIWPTVVLSQNAPIDTAGTIIIKETPRTRTDSVGTGKHFKKNGAPRTGFAYKGERHSPKKAALFSAALPGLGQIYNRKYWKLPIVYGALGGLTYSIVRNRSRWKTYSNALTLRLDGDSTTIDDFTDISDAGITDLKSFYKRNMDLSIIFGSVVYLLNIIDAAVDAHLFDFDVSDDLSMRIQPVINLDRNMQGFTGLRIQFSY